MHFGDVARLVGFVVHVGHDVGALQSDRPTRCQTEPLLVDPFHFEVLRLDVELSSKRDVSRPFVWVFGVVDCGQHVHLTLRVIDDHHLDRAQHGHGACGGGVQVVAERKLQQPHVDDVVPFGHPHAIAKFADALRRISPSTQPTERRHARVVPTVHHTLLHQTKQLPLGHDGVVEVEAGEFTLLGRENAKLLDVPFVQRTVHFEFQRAQAVGDAFDAVRLAVCKVVHRINAPRVARPVVGREFDAVHQRVPHVHVGVGHVNLGPEHHAPFRVLALAHFLEQGQILLHRAVTKRTRLPGSVGVPFWAAISSADCSSMYASPDLIN